MASRAKGLRAAIVEELGRIEQLLAAWWEKGRDGDKESTDRIIALQKQRLSLIQMREELGRKTKERARPVEIVFVDDWRQEVE